MLQNIPDWIPFACLLSGRVDIEKPLVTRLVELLVVSALSGAGSMYVGFRLMERDVQELGTKFAMHEKLNTDYRAEQAIAKRSEDAKWDARITRLENCFIVRQCGK